MKWCPPSLTGSPPSLGFSKTSMTGLCVVALLLVVAMVVVVVKAMVEVVEHVLFFIVVSLLKLTCMLATDSSGIASPES